MAMLVACHDDTLRPLRGTVRTFVGWDSSVKNKNGGVWKVRQTNGGFVQSKRLAPLTRAEGADALAEATAATGVAGWRPVGPDAWEGEVTVNG